MKEPQREIMLTVDVTTYARMEPKYEWNVQKVRPSVPGKGYVTNMKPPAVTITCILKTGDAKTKEK
jgi:hypothetical protein